MLFGQSIGIVSSVFTPDASAMLEVQSTNKGLLIPRVSLTSTSSASPVTSPATSLLVYNTATINDVTPGYYYWNGSKWVRLLDDQLWEDVTNYIKPKTSITGATYPYIMDDTYTGTFDGNSAQMYFRHTGSQMTSLYIYSNQNTSGTGYGYAQSYAPLKVYDFWGNQYNPAIAGYSFLDYNYSSAILGAHQSGTPRAELATRSPTYTGSSSNALYSLKLDGDFYNQDINYGQSTYPTGATWTLRSVTVTYHGSANSSLLIHGEIDYFLDTPWPIGGGYVVWALYRDGVEIAEISEYSEDEVDKTIHIQWIDQPTEGTHTYELRTYYQSGTMYYYGHQLHITEVKK